MKQKLTDMLNIVMGVRFERCQLKDFVERQEHDNKYQKCYDCQGTDASKYCYSRPMERIWRP